MEGKEKVVMEEPILLPDKAIWHPVAPDIVFETNEDYFNWYNTQHCPEAGIDPKTAPTIGIILQKSHINTKDDTHYVSLIAELESRGSRVVPIYSGGLDFSGEFSVAPETLPTHFNRVILPFSTQDLSRNTTTTVSASPSSTP